MSKALAHAAAAGDLAAVRLLLRAQPDAARHWQPIMNAAFHGRAEVVATLLDHGADPNAVARNGRRHRPLHRCIEAKRTVAKTPGHLEVVRVLASRGADLALPAGPQGWTPLQLAAFGGLADFVDLLLELGAPVDLASAAMLYDLQGMHSRVAAESALVDARDAAGRTPLHALAASSMWRAGAGTSADAVAAAGLLLEAGADLNAKQPIPDGGAVFMATPLWWAAVQQDHVALCRHLSSLGARPEGCAWGVAYNGNVGLLKLLVAHGAPIHPRSAEGRKLLQDLLYFCLHFRRPKAVRWLLAQGADPNLTDPAGRTALHVAVGARVRTEVLSWLLAASADVGAKDAVGRTALDLARVKGHSKAIEMMRDCASPARTQTGALSTTSRVLTPH